MKEKTRFFIFAVALIFLLSLLFVILSNFRQTPTTKIRAGYLPITGSLVLFIAQEKEFFKDVGLDVELSQFSQSSHIVEGVSTNKIDVGIIATDSLFAAELTNPGAIKIVALISTSNKTSMEAVLVQKNSSINSLKDLEGKKIGVFPGSTAKSFLKYVLEKKDIKTEKIEFIPLTSSLQISALEAGSVDAIFSYEPTNTIALEKGTARTLYSSIFSEAIDPAYTGALCLSSEFITDHPNEAQKFKDAMYKSIDYLRKNPTESKKLLSKVISIPEEVALKISHTPDWVKVEEMNKTLIQNYADFLVNLKLLNSKIDISKLFYAT